VPVAEPAEFDAYVVTRRRSWLRAAWLLTGDWHAAEDLVQTALMRCYPKWQRISKGDPDAYVRRAIFNVYASWWRRRWRSERATDEPPEVSVSGDVYADLDERSVMVTALAILPPRQRAVIVLRFYEDLTESQIAELLGCALGTVKSQTAKALGTLRSSGVLLSAEQAEVRHD
jgi:RNA polymerase sigma-70 factor (sigma-E family)